MTKLQREVLKSIVPLAILTAIVAVVSKAIGGWVQVMGPMVIVIGAAMVWGTVLRAKLNREADKGDQHE
ncbi:hypothetical protein [Streptomyces sp. ATCC 21386]|uniref:hypothetical protein n=1 Tax=Streptomyces sp. ATCC 21386 TaxID=2699428 RepID=UPI001BFF6CB9|nr:hypothetical protein [Streptomyces sp. ATCC 21386]